MMYFDKLPKITYNFLGSGDVQVVDIFRRVNFTQRTLEDPNNFEKYTIIEGERPEDIAYKIYGDEDLWWVVMLTNNIINYANDWSKTQRELSNLFEKFLSGRSFHLFEDLDIKKDDVVVRRDVEGGTASLDMDNYGVVDSHDRLLHKTDVKKIKGTISDGDEVYIFRRGYTASGPSGSYYPIEGFGQTGCFQSFYVLTYGCIDTAGPSAGFAPLCATVGSTFGIVQKAVDIKDGLVKFEYDSGDANPYATVGPVGLSGDFFDYKNMCGLTGTLLYRYLTDSIGTDVTVVTKTEDIIFENDKKRTINILSPALLPDFLSEVGLLFGTEIHRGTTRIVE